MLFRSLPLDLVTVKVVADHLHHCVQSSEKVLERQS